MLTKPKPLLLNMIGDCTMDDVIEYLFGDASAFACLVEENGDEFVHNNVKVTYDDVTDIHTFWSV